MKTSKKIIISLLIVASIFTVINYAQAQLVTEKLSNDCASKDGCGLCDFIDLVINAANILVGLSGTFAILMFVYGGIVWITAYGNEARIKWGRDILIATVTGIAIVFFAWMFVNVILGALLGKSNPTLPPNSQPWYNPTGLCTGGTTK